MQQSSIIMQTKTNFTSFMMLLSRISMWSPPHWIVGTRSTSSGPSEANLDKSSTRAQLHVSYSICMFCGLHVWRAKRTRERTRERVAKPRGAEERRACKNLLQIFISASPGVAHVSVLTGLVFFRSQYNVIDTSPYYLPRLALLFCR